jgi:hypothetical protein
MSESAKSLVSQPMSPAISIRSAANIFGPSLLGHLFGLGILMKEFVLPDYLTKSTFGGFLPDRTRSSRHTVALVACEHVQLLCFAHPEQSPHHLPHIHDPRAGFTDTGVLATPYAIIPMYLQGFSYKNHIFSVALGGRGAKKVPVAEL